MQKVREAAARTQCLNNLKQIGLGLHAYHDTFKQFPNAGSDGPTVTCCKADDRVGWTWMYHITPFVEQANVYNDPTDANVASTPVKIYYCPTRRQPTVYGSASTARCDYAGNGGRDMAGAGKEGVFMRQWATLPQPAGTNPNQRRSITDISDGTSNTIMVGEKQCHPTVLGTSGGDNEVWNNSGWDQDHVRFGEQVPQRDDLHPSSTQPTYWSERFGGSHPGGFTAVMCDGSVKFIRYGIDSTNWLRVCLVNDGEVISAEL